MKWNTKKSATMKTAASARETLVSKTVLDDLLKQISGGAVYALSACHPQDAF